MPRPSEQQIEDACREESEALKHFSRITRQKNTFTLKEIAARKRLSLARANKSNVMHDLLAYPDPEPATAR